jgi:hypothetical protein
MVRADSNDSANIKHTRQHEFSELIFPNVHLRPLLLESGMPFIRLTMRRNPAVGTLRCCKARRAI